MAKIKVPNYDFLLYVVPSDSSANLNHVYKIWTKYTGVLTNDEKEFLKTIESKNIKDYSIAELTRYQNIKRQLEVHNLLLDKFKNKTCTKEECELVQSIMSIGLTKFILSRLEEGEFIKANISLNNYKTEEDLELFIKETEQNYESLSPFDAYVLFLAYEKLDYIRNEKANEKLRDETIMREMQLRRKLINDYGYIR